jgi:hypothetical protein
MLIEIDGQFYSSTDDFYSPEWWDEWQKENFKKKSASFQRKVLKTEEDYTNNEG